MNNPRFFTALKTNWANWYFLWGGDPLSEGYLVVAPHEKYQLECQIAAIGTFYGGGDP